MNNETFAITVQSAICDLNSITEAQLNSNRVSKSLKQEIIPTIKSALAKFPAQPISCDTFSKIHDKGKFKNFTLKNGMSLKVRTNMSNNDKQAPNVVGQISYDMFEEYFGFLLPGNKVTKETIKFVVLNYASEMLPIYLDYFFICDILLWIYMKKSNYRYQILRRCDYPDIIWDPRLLTFTQTTGWNWSNTIKYNGISLGEFQFHRNRGGFKFRFCLKNLLKILSELRINNESLGITAEKIICDMFSLERPKHINSRALPHLEKSLVKSVTLAFKQIPKPTKYLGAQTGSGGGKSKSDKDFQLNSGKSLSLKTNWGRMVCPPKVGQPTKLTFVKHFGHLLDGEFSVLRFKKTCLTKTSEMMEIYLNQLLTCDYILWIYSVKKSAGLDFKFDFEVVDCKKILKLQWQQDLFSFSQTEISWKESCSCRYRDISIGAFQIHSNRNCFKFRFNFPNLLTLLDQNV